MFFLFEDEEEEKVNYGMFYQIYKFVLHHAMKFVMLT